MSDVRFSSAVNAYKGVLQAAERVITKSGGGEAEESAESRAESFLEMVGSALKSSEAKGYQSEFVADKALAGKADIADVINAVSSAENALQTVVAVRDKVINAYQEIIRMQI